MISAQITGESDLASALAGISKKVKTTIGKEAVTTAATTLESVAKRHAEWSEDTGALKASIGIRTKAMRGGARIFGIVGPRYGFARPNPDGKGTRDPAKYGHLVENGTSHSTPKAFMRPAFAEKKGVMLQDMARVIGNGVKAEAEKQGQKRKNKGRT